MHCPAFRHDPAGLQQRYVQELILVAERGGPDLHQLFLERYREQLGCLPSWLPAFGPTGMADVFRGATEARRGKLPPSVLSYRLALPKWFSLRLQDPWAAWRLHQTYIPGEIAVDPVCLMFLDVSEARYVTERMGERIYFCCEHCRRLFDGDEGGSSARSPVRFAA